MKKRTKKKAVQLSMRLGVFALALMTAVAFLPLTGGVAFAKDNAKAGQAAAGTEIVIEAPSAAAKKAGLNQETIDAIAGDAGLSEDEVIAAAKAEGIATPDQGGPVDLEALTVEDEDPAFEAQGGGTVILRDLKGSYVKPDAWPACPEYTGGNFSWTDDEYDEDLGEWVDVNRSVTASLNVTLHESTGTLEVSGNVSEDEFDYLCVDGYYEQSLSGSSFSTTLDMKNFDVGYHSISAKLYHSDGEVYYPQAVPTYVYEKPENKLNSYTTGKNYFVFTGGDNTKGCDTFLEYKKSGGKWSAPQGPFSYGDAKKKGLKSNTKYTTRTYYGAVVNYNNTNYLFTGKDRGLVSTARTMKTAMGKKPPVKSVSIKSKKQWSYSYWVHYYNYGVYAYSKKYTVWQTKAKITVKMKKKPGTTGIYVGNIKMKGNKNSYSKTVTLSGKQKGKRLKVCIQSYQHTVYGGFSPKYHKKVRVR